MVFKKRHSILYTSKDLIGAPTKKLEIKRLILTFTKSKFIPLNNLSLSFHTTHIKDNIANNLSTDKAT